LNRFESHLRGWLGNAGKNEKPLSAGGSFANTISTMGGAGHRRKMFYMLRRHGPGFPDRDRAWHWRSPGVGVCSVRGATARADAIGCLFDGIATLKAEKLSMIVDGQKRASIRITAHKTDAARRIRISSRCHVGCGSSPNSGHGVAADEEDFGAPGRSNRCSARGRHCIGVGASTGTRPGTGTTAAVILSDQGGFCWASASGARRFDDAPDLLGGCAGPDLPGFTGRAKKKRKLASCIATALAGSHRVVDRSKLFEFDAVVDLGPIGDVGETRSRLHSTNHRASCVYCA